MLSPPKLKAIKFAIVLCFGLMLFINMHVSGQSADFPKPFEITSDTATNIILPALNWQYFKEGDKQLSLSDVISAPHIFKFKSNSSSKQDLIRLQGYWFRYRLKNDLDSPLDITMPGDLTQVDFYIADNQAEYNHFVTGKDIPWSKRAGLKKIRAVTYALPPKSIITVYQRNLSDDDSFPLTVTIGIKDNIIAREYINNDTDQIGALVNAAVFGFLLFAALFNFFFFYIIREKVYLLYGIMLLLVAVYNISEPLPNLVLRDHPVTFNSITSIFFVLTVPLGTIIVPIFLQTAQRHPKWNKVLLTASFVLFAGLILQWLSVLINGYISKVIAAILIVVIIFLIAGIVVTFIIDLLKRRFAARLFMVAIAPCLFAIILISVVAFVESIPEWLWILLEMTLLWPVIVLCWAMFDRFKSVLHENARQAIEKERLAREKEEERSKLITRQKEELEIQVAERTHELSQSLNHLKATQTQLIQAEKMASLGELTAGIAHEIQNPLNFVNNFSEVNEEMIVELRDELKSGNIDEALTIASDIEENEKKIRHHGKRADSIVKGMLEHSRVGTGEKQLIDINALADEYLRLAYHGLRAKNKDFNAELITNYDAGLPKANTVPQDISRVMLNLFNNAFYAVNQKQKIADTAYRAEVSVRTSAENGQVVIKVKDNGVGIPDTIKGKIMQPFFTTKPTGEGTGLGLSLTYDMVVKGHGGKIEVNTKEGEFTEFIVTLPLNEN